MCTNRSWKSTGSRNKGGQEVISSTFFTHLSITSIFITIRCYHCKQVILLIGSVELNHVWLFLAPWTIVCQAPLSMELPRQEYWSALPFPPPGDSLALYSGIKPEFLVWQEAHNTTLTTHTANTWNFFQIVKNSNVDKVTSFWAHLVHSFPWR